MLRPRHYHAIDLLAYVEARPAEIGAEGDYLTVTNARGEEVVWRISELRPFEPVVVIGLDDQALIDRMFELQPEDDARGVVEGLQRGSFRSHLRVGQYGVHYVPSSMHFEDLEAAVSHTGQLRAALDATGWQRSRTGGCRC